jgi:hypothetical protein
MPILVKLNRAQLQRVLSFYYHYRCSLIISDESEEQNSTEEEGDEDEEADEAEGEGEAEAEGEADEPRAKEETESIGKFLVQLFK